MTFAQGDLNGDGSVSGSDFAMLAANFGKSVAAPALVSAPGAVPAPALVSAPASTAVAPSTIRRLPVKAAPLPRRQLKTAAVRTRRPVSR